jgi:hypothetical protein
MQPVASVRTRAATRSGQIWTGLAGAYLVAVAVLEATRDTAGFPDPTDLAASPAAIASGKLWLLFTSALPVAGRPVLGLGGTTVSVIEVVGLSLSVAVLVSRHGGAIFWLVAIAGHVGGTLLTYGGVGVLWLVDHDTVSSVVHTLDYGVSAVWLAVLGGLAVSFYGDRRHLLPFAACVAAGLIGATLFSGFADAEHALAFVLGALVVALSG